MLTKAEKIRLILDIKNGRIDGNIANAIKTGVLVTDSRKEYEAVKNYINKSGIKLLMFVACDLKD